MKHRLPGFLHSHLQYSEISPSIIVDEIIFDHRRSQFYSEIGGMPISPQFGAGLEATELAIRVLIEKLLTL
jgi:hypothetical protein